MTRRSRLMLWAMLSVAAFAACSKTADSNLTELRRAKGGDLDVVVLSSKGAITHGQDAFVVEFRAADGTLVDVGDVKASSTMPMPGTPMFGSLDVKRTGVPGRYDVDAKFDMAGTWRITIDWKTPGEVHSATLSTTVQ